MIIMMMIMRRRFLGMTLSQRSTDHDDNVIQLTTELDLSPDQYMTQNKQKSPIWTMTQTFSSLILGIVVPHFCHIHPNLNIFLSSHFDQTQETVSVLCQINFLGVATLRQLSYFPDDDFDFLFLGLQISTYFPRDCQTCSSFHLFLFSNDLRLFSHFVSDAKTIGQVNLDCPIHFYLTLQVFCSCQKLFSLF